MPSKNSRREVAASVRDWTFIWSSIQIENMDCHSNIAQSERPKDKICQKTPPRLAMSVPAAGQVAVRPFGPVPRYRLARQPRRAHDKLWFRRHDGRDDGTVLMTRLDLHPRGKVRRVRRSESAPLSDTCMFRLVGVRKRHRRTRHVASAVPSCTDLDQRRSPPTDSVPHCCRRRT